jgi:hypothetical protein
VLDVHGTTLSTQSQCPVTEFALQDWFAAQAPPHCGASA